MIIIDSEDKLHKYQKYLEIFREIYFEAFPDEMEREEFSDILVRISEDFPKTIIILSLESDEVLGGMIVDVYQNKVFHLTYLITNQKFRGKGTAKYLVNQCLESLIKHLKSDSNGVFVETNIPWLTKNDSFEPIIRVGIFNKLKMKWIPIEYIQPPLSLGKDKVSNLFLLYYPINDVELKITEVEDFLDCLYQSLGQDLTDSDLLKMKLELNQKFSNYITLTTIPTEL